MFSSDVIREVILQNPVEMCIRFARRSGLSKLDDQWIIYRQYMFVYG